VLGAVARGDIAPAREYGAALAPWGETSIRMAREDVVIRLEAARAVVHARFVLESSSAETVQQDIGFPDAVKAGVWSSDVTQTPRNGFPALQDFVARIDGERIEGVPRYYQSDVGPLERTELARSYREREARIRATVDAAERKRLEEALDRDREQFGWWSGRGWLVWPMTFEPRATHVVEVDYHLPYRGPYSYDLRGFHAVEYVLVSGGFWDGPIGRAVITVELADGCTHEHLDALPALGREGYERTETGFRWDLHDLEPAEDLAIVRRDYLDMKDAARGYTARADACRDEGKPAAEAQLLGWAWEAAREAGMTDGMVDLARRVRDCEHAVVEAGAEHPRVRRDVRSKYEPWEWRYVESLLAAGRRDEARAAAREALPYLRAWKQKRSEPHYPWGDVAWRVLDEAIARCEALSAD